MGGETCRNDIDREIVYLERRQLHHQSWVFQRLNDIATSVAKSRHQYTKDALLR